jgi:CRP/FNR family transcriptional regulator
MYIQAVASTASKTDLAALGLSRGASSQVSLVTSLHRKAAGEVLFAQGDKMDTIYEVVRGMLCLYKILPDGRRQIIDFLSEGQLLLSSAPDGTCLSTAEAITEVTLCRYPRAAFERLICEVPGLAHRILTMTSHELNAAQEQMLLLGRKAATEKVASFLLLMADRQGGCKAENEIDLPMGRTDIADYLGLTVETVSRTFSRLKHDGLIALQTPNCIHIRDRERLEELAVGDADTGL